MTRAELWQRLVDKDYFDWCRRAEIKKLEALFFEGVTEESPEEYLTVRELFWHPIQTPEHWDKMLELRSENRSGPGEVQVSETLARDWVFKNYDYLMQMDLQYVGLDIKTQQQMSRFLASKKPSALRLGVYVNCWLEGVIYWLWAENKEEWDSSGFSESKFAANKAEFYRLLEDAPFELHSKKFVFAGDKEGWWPNAAFSLEPFFRDFFKMVRAYKPPKSLTCDKTPRLTFLEGVRDDLEGGKAPKLFQDYWLTVKK